MTRFVAINNKLGGTQPTEKYVKQTYDAMSNNNINLENIAIQISQLPVREQKRFFQLFINFADISASKAKIHYSPAMRDLVDLSEGIIELVNDYYSIDQMEFELEMK